MRQKPHPTRYLPVTEVGAIYTGKVVRLADVGAFVNILAAKDGLVYFFSNNGEECVQKVSGLLHTAELRFGCSSLSV